MNYTQLKELGLDAAAETLQKKIDLKRKLMIAYEHFKFVSPGIVRKFQAALKAKSKKETNFSTTYDRLVFIPLATYAAIPPPDCLLDLKKAKDMNCFDAFEVAKIQAVVERKDPIIFGTIQGCQDLFFISQWDSDCSFEEIMEAQ